MIRRPPRSTLDRSSAASDVYKRQRQRRRCAIVRRHVKLEDVDTAVLGHAILETQILWNRRAGVIDFVLDLEFLLAGGGHDRGVGDTLGRLLLENPQARRQTELGLTVGVRRHLDRRGKPVALARLGTDDPVGQWLVRVIDLWAVSFSHLRAPQTLLDIVFPLLLCKKKKTHIRNVSMVP